MSYIYVMHETENDRTDASIIAVTADEFDRDMYIEQWAGRQHGMNARGVQNATRHMIIEEWDMTTVKAVWVVRWQNTDVWEDVEC